MIILQPRFSGRYRLLIGQPSQAPRIDTGWFDNLVLDSGLNRIGSGNWFTHCQVGTNNTPPQVTNTALAGLFATSTTITESVGGAQGSEPYYGYLRKRFSFTQGTFANTNLSEVGVGWDTGLFSRALTVDAEGNPTTITVLSNEGLDVLYEIRLYPPLTDQTSEITVGSTTYTLTARAANVTSSSSTVGWAPSGGQALQSSPSNAPFVYDGLIGAITTSPSGNSAVSASRSTSSYSNNSLQVAMSANWALTAGNFAAGIKSLLFYTTGVGAWQIGIDPPITKTSLDALTMYFQVAWSRP